MAEAILVRTAAAVLAALVAAPANTFTQTFAAERSYADWEEKLTELGKLKVDVVPVIPLPTELESRGSIGYEPSVDIVVRKRFEEAQQKESDGRIKLEEIDALVKFVEQIAEYFTAERLDDAFEDAAWDSTKIPAAYKPSHLRLHRQFTGIVRLTFTANNAL